MRIAESLDGAKDVVPARVENQEDMNYDPVKAPPTSRRKIMPPTPQQSLQPSIEAVQLQTEVGCDMEYEGEHQWS